MPLTYKQNYVVYLLTISLAFISLTEMFPSITEFRLESFPIASVKNLLGIGLFYLASQIYKRQVDFY